MASRNIRSVFLEIAPLPRSNPNVAHRHQGGGVIAAAGFWKKLVATGALPQQS